jgi:hypothetical protein
MYTIIDALKRIKSYSPDPMAKDVAIDILNNYRANDVIGTNKVGFWWHVDGDRKYTTVYLHAHCNPINQPNGPWHIEHNYHARIPAGQKSLTKNVFELVGFRLMPGGDSGPDVGEGDKALDFEFVGVSGAALHDGHDDL